MHSGIELTLLQVLLEQKTISHTFEHIQSISKLFFADMSSRHIKVLN